MLEDDDLTDVHPVHHRMFVDQDEMEQAALKESMTAAIQNLIGSWPTALPPAIENTVPGVTRDALHNTKVAHDPIFWHHNNRVHGKKWPTLLLSKDRNH